MSSQGSTHKESDDMKSFVADGLAKELEIRWEDQINERKHREMIWKLHEEKIFGERKWPCFEDAEYVAAQNAAQKMSQ